MSFQKIDGHRFEAPGFLSRRPGPAPSSLSTPTSNWCRLHPGHLTLHARHLFFVRRILCGAGLANAVTMHRIEAALYARVSTDQQSRGQTIVSQVAALRERI